MSDDDAQLAAQLAQRGREVVLERLRAAFDHQIATRPTWSAPDPARLEELVREAAQRVDRALWRRSIAQAVMEKLDVGLPEALSHPLLASAHLQPATPPADGPSDTPADGPSDAATAPSDTPAAGNAGAQTLRLDAVHLAGIETLRPGDRDIELRLSPAGLDVLKRSSGAAVGRLEWGEIELIELPPPRRGLRRRRRLRELHVSTGRGQAHFELPGLTEAELHEHVEPMLTRLRGADRPDPAR